MARAASWATALVVVALVAVAALDAVRGSDGDEPAPPATIAEPGLPDRADVARRLRELGIGGRLVYTDERCALRALSLPALRETARPATIGDSCTFSLSPDGRRAAFASGDWSPDGRFVAVCRGTIVGVYVRREIGRAVQAWDGCVPAWRPDGVLTLVRDGELLEVRPGCAAPPCERVLLGRADLLRAAATYPNAREVPGRPDAPEVEDAVWLSPSRVAVLLRVDAGGQARRDLVAVFSGRRLVAANPEADDHLVALERGPRAAYLLGAPDRVYAEDGSPLVLPPGLGAVRAVAVSPDERLLAVATRSGIAILRIDALARGEARVARIAVAARDLDWR